MIVMKFDAVSIGSQRIGCGRSPLVHQQSLWKPVVVTSALPKVTDLLLEAVNSAAAWKKRVRGQVSMSGLHFSTRRWSRSSGPGRRCRRRRWSDLHAAGRGAAHLLYCCLRPRKSLTSLHPRRGGRHRRSGLSFGDRGRRWVGRRRGSGGGGGGRAHASSSRTRRLRERSRPCRRKMALRVRLKLEPMLGTVFVPATSVAPWSSSCDGRDHVLSVSGAAPTPPRPCLDPLLEAQETADLDQDRRPHERGPQGGGRRRRSIA